MKNTDLIMLPWKYKDLLHLSFDAGVFCGFCDDDFSAVKVAFALWQQNTTTAYIFYRKCNGSNYRK